MASIIGSLAGFIERCVFLDKLDAMDAIGERKPVFQFDLFDETYAVLPPKWNFWIQLTVVSDILAQLIILFLLSIISSLLISHATHSLNQINFVQIFFVLINSTLVYYLVIERRSSKKRIYPTFQGMIVGYGIVLPICIYYPRYIYHLLNIHNVVIRFALAAVPIAGLFRCTEAIYGFAPDSTTITFKTYFFYWLAPVEHEIRQDSKNKSTSMPVAATLPYFIETAHAFLIGFLKMSLLFSLLSPFHFRIFATPSNNGEVWKINDYVGIGNLINNFLVAVLFQQALATFGPGLSLIASSLTGIRYRELMMNPMFTATSPSDFWGRKWNRFVHSLLKLLAFREIRQRGVYKPVRSFHSGTAATVATFVVSGLFHEWVLWSVFVKGEGDSVVYSPSYGMQTRFFIWNAIVISLEQLVGHWSIFQWMKLSLPTIIKALLTVSLSLPVAHWFLDEYTNAQYFDHMSLAFPLVIKVEND